MIRLRLRRAIGGAAAAADLAAGRPGMRSMGGQTPLMAAARRGDADVLAAVTEQAEQTAREIADLERRLQERDTSQEAEIATLEEDEAIMQRLVELRSRLLVSASVDVGAGGGGVRAAKDGARARYPLNEFPFVDGRRPSGEPKKGVWGLTHLAKVLVNAEIWVEEGGAAAGGLTPLGLAALRGHTASVARLLEAGADPEAPLEGGATALMLAAAAGEAAVVEALLAAIAERAEQTAREIADLERRLQERDVSQEAEIANVKADTAIMQQVEALRSRRGGVFARTEGGHPPLAFAAAGGDAATARLLLNAGAELNRTFDGGRSALWVAAAEGSVEVVALLLEAGAGRRRAAGRGDEQRSAELAQLGAEAEHLAEHLALATADGGVAEAGEAARRRKGELEVAGGGRAEPELWFDVADAEGLTPLAAAALYGHAEVVALLLEAGASVEGGPAAAGVTPLLLCIAHDDAAVGARLLAAGADPNAALPGRGSALLCCAHEVHTHDDQHLMMTPLVPCSPHTVY
jgi:ankyrin repeat protein